MFTQCQHCKAIFEVNMREITVAKGDLRCGECHQVFNASKTLSSNMPKPYSHTADETEALGKHKHNETSIRSGLQVKGVEPPFYQKTKFIAGVALSLALLLALQVLYNYKHLFWSKTPHHEPDKVSMLNHNVFAHPIEQDVLLISATIENNADHDQPYPVLEVRLSDSQSNLVALRRFSADEYLENYKQQMLFKKSQVTSLKLKIKDPGNKATRFQFDFL